MSNKHGLHKYYANKDPLSKIEHPRPVKKKEEEEPPLKKQKTRHRKKRKIIPTSPPPPRKQEKKFDESGGSDDDAFIQKLESNTKQIQSNTTPLESTVILTDLDDLKKELDLSDSEDDLSGGILHHKSSKKTVKRSLNSLVKDLSKRATTSEERNALDAELRRSIDKNYDTDGSFNMIPGAEELRVNPSIRYRGTDLVWNQSYSFANWYGKDLTLLVDTTDFVEGIKDCTPHLKRFLKSLVKNRDMDYIVNAFVVGHCFNPSSIILPDSILSWMVKNVAYSNDSSLMIYCFCYLDSLINQCEFSRTIALYPSNTFTKNRIPKKLARTYFIPYLLIIEIMENYGLPANDKRDYPVLHAYSPNCPIKMGEFPESNFSYIISLIESSVNTDAYSVAELDILLKMVCHFLIGPELSESIPPLQSLLTSLLNHLPEYTWTGQGLKELTEKILKIRETFELHHFAKLAANFPVGASNDKTTLFRCSFSYHCLRKLLKLNEPKIESNNDSPYVSLEILGDIILKLAELNIEEKEKSDDFNYTNLYAKIMLIDNCLDKNYLSKREHKSLCDTLSENLGELNITIPETSSIIISRTRVKEYISRLIASTQMIKSMGSKIQNEENAITNFFKSTKDS